jgi:hypothetical protein
MNSTVRQQWRQFKRARPGHRFEMRYEHHQRTGGTHAAPRRLLLWLAAVASTVIGVVLIFVPGPAVLFFLIAGGLLATESRALARCMDQIELKTRAVCEWCSRRWRRLSLGGRCVVCFGFLLVAVGSAAVAYRLFFAH